MNTFRNMADFINNAIVGDTFTDNGDRTVTTYNVVEVAEIPTIAGSVRDRVLVVNKVTTRHYGRADYAGRPEKCYRSVATIRDRVGVVNRENGYAFISWVQGESKGSYLVAKEDAARFSAKKMAEIHADAFARAF